MAPQGAGHGLYVEMRPIDRKQLTFISLFKKFSFFQRKSPFLIPVRVDLTGAAVFTHFQLIRLPSVFCFNLI